MGSNGMPDLSGITPVSPGVYQGNGWEYENGTLTLESGSYDFFTTKPTTKNGKVLALVECTVVVKTAPPSPVVGFMRCSIMAPSKTLCSFPMAS